MFSKILSIILLPLFLIISLFVPTVEIDEKPATVSEAIPAASEYRTYDKITGNGSEFYIERPKALALNAVNAEVFGLDEKAEDNTLAFQKAIAYCKNNPGTRLIINSGSYYFAVSDALVFDGVNSCLIEGDGARFIFENPGMFFRIANCDCVEINGITIDVDRVNNPIDDVLKIQNSDSENHTLEFCFFEKDEIDENMALEAITQCDPETLTFGAKNMTKECYIYQNPDCIKEVKKTGANVLKITHDGSFDNYLDGETYILRHHIYDGEVLRIINSKNVTIESVNIYGGYGIGCVGSDKTNHWQIVNSHIGLDPNDKTGAHVSLGADAVHIADTAGYFNLENCDISCQGDDALNIHDCLGYVFDVNGNTVKMYSSAARLAEGEYLAFKDKDFSEINYEAKIISVTALEGTVKQVELDRDVSDMVFAGYIAYNTACNSGNYVIRNNYIHENRARGLLLQSDNGLCENNRFYKTQGQAIKIVMDIRPMLWQEGTGVNNLIIRNNAFDSCDYCGWGEQITIDSFIDGDTAKCYAFKNIVIKDNTFKNFSFKALSAMNVNGLEFTGNTIEAEDERNIIYIGNYCANVTVGNTCKGKYRNKAAIVETENFIDYVKINGNVRAKF